MSSRESGDPLLNTPLSNNHPDETLLANDN